MIMSDMILELIPITKVTLLGLIRRILIIIGIPYIIEFAMVFYNYNKIELIGLTPIM